MRASISIRDQSGFSVGRGKANRGIMVYWIFGKFFQEGGFCASKLPFFWSGITLSPLITFSSGWVIVTKVGSERMLVTCGFFVVLKESGFFPLRSWFSYQTIHPNDYNDEKGSFGLLMHWIKQSTLMTRWWCYWLSWVTPFVKAESNRFSLPTVSFSRGNRG